MRDFRATHDRVRQCSIIACILSSLAAPSLAVAQEARVEQPERDERPPTEVQDESYPNQTMGESTPGKGFDISKTDFASLNLSFYGLARYINQLPATQSFTDHLGRERPIDTRNDIYWQRTFLWATGFLFTPRLTYSITGWSLLSTQQTLLFGYLQFAAHRALLIGTGIGPNMGTRSLQGPWPYFMSSDRQMVDEFVRPGFTPGVWLKGEPLPKLFYGFMLGNNLSILGVSSQQLTRDLSTSGTIYWMPTTGEFGPRGGFNDFEIHNQVATRFGVSAVHSREDRFNDIVEPLPINTQIRISDGLLFFETGALADGVTVDRADYDLLSFDAGLKYKGFHFQTEVYFRFLSDFVADGPLPLSSIEDQGFYVQTSYSVVSRLIDVYAVGGLVFDEFDRHPWEIGGGVNGYPSKTRSWRLNLHLLRVEQSPTGSQFGFYVPGQTGTIISVGTDILL